MQYKAVTLFLKLLVINILNDESFSFAAIVLFDFADGDGFEGVGG